jgi:NAD(P)-dependent dehydrogenase (short-subunit alcohol dehydrogenase family)
MWALDALRKGGFMIVQSLVGQRVVVLGGGSGIGRAVAQAARDSGGRVAIIGRTEAALALAAAEIGPDVDWRTADAGNPAAILAALNALAPVDHLVLTPSASAAALGVQVDLGAMPLDAARRFVEGKFWAQVTAAQAALGVLSPGGSVVLTSGVASRKGLPGHAVIAATNAALEAFVRQIAREIAPRRINAVAPGLTRTAVYDRLPEAERQAFFARVTADQPIPRPAEPAEVAQAYVFAMTASFVTGTVIDVDGGKLVG